MERRNFLKHTCPTLTFAFFGLSFIEACSKPDDGISSNVTSSINSSTGTYVSDAQSNNGIEKSGNTLTLDLTNSTFNGIVNPGNFINITSEGVLLLKISNTEFRAFDNCCPHSGSRNAWSYSNDEFVCATHGNSFGINGNNIVNCGEAATSGDLKTYSTSLSGDLLTITVS